MPWVFLLWSSWRLILDVLETWESSTIRGRKHGRMGYWHCGWKTVPFWVHVACKCGINSARMPIMPKGGVWSFHMQQHPRAGRETFVQRGDEAVCWDGAFGSKHSYLGCGGYIGYWQDTTNSCHLNRRPSFETSIKLIHCVSCGEFVKSKRNANVVQGGEKRRPAG